LTESVYGNVGREIMEEVVRAGCISLSKLIYICGHRVKNNTKDLKISALFDQLKLFRSTIQSLIKGKCITICDLMIELEKTPELEAHHQMRINREFIRIPQIDLNLICTKIMTEAVEKSSEDDEESRSPKQAKKNEEEEIDMESFIDADVLWSINIPQYHCDSRNEMIMEAMDNKFKDMMVDTRVIKIIIELGFAKDPWGKTGTPVSTPEIKDKIEKLPNGGLTSKFLKHHMDIFRELIN